VVDIILSFEIRNYGPVGSASSDLLKRIKVLDDNAMKVMSGKEETKRESE